MSWEYQAVMVSTIELEKRLTPKIMFNTIESQEAALLLNTEWALYLYALKEGDFEEACDIAEVICLLEHCIRMQGYVVSFLTTGYCVQER